MRRRQILRDDGVATRSPRDGGGGTTQQPQWDAGSDMLPPWRRRPEAVSRPAEKERARNWEERMQQNSWAQGRPTHGRETSPNRTHNKTQGNHEVRALQQPPNAAHAERAISKHPPSLYKVPTYSTRAGAAPRAPGGARHGGGNRAVNSQPGTGQSTSYRDVKSSYGGAGGWDRRGCATWAPRSATRQGEEQHRHTERGSHTRRDKGGHNRQGGGAQQGGRGNWNSGNREPEWSGWQSVRMGGSDNKGDGLASQPRRYRVPGQPLLNRHQVGGVSRSPDGLFAQQEWEPIRGRPAVRGKGAYGGRPGQRVEEGTWVAQKHSKAGDGRPVDRGAWTAKTVKQPQQQPAHPQYANYWAPLTRKRHTMPHPAQSQHANYWAPRTRKRHQPEHRPQRPTESSNPTQHAKGRTGDRPGPRKGATTRRNVTQGVGCWTHEGQGDDQPRRGRSSSASSAVRGSVQEAAVARAGLTPPPCRSSAFVGRCVAEVLDGYLSFRRGPILTLRVMAPSRSALSYADRRPGRAVDT